MRVHYILVANAIIVASCAAGIEDGQITAIGAATDGGAPTVVTVSIPQDPRLDPALIIDGCQAWSAVEVTCKIALERESQIAFRISDRPCTPNPDGTVTLADAYAYPQVIVLYWQCLSRSTDLPTLLRSVATHEVGHLLGLGHVPLSCEEADGGLPIDTSHSGVPICGRAQMNPLVDSTLDGTITAYDLFAYELHGRDVPLTRDRDASIPGLEDAGAPTGRSVGCSLRMEMP